MARTKKQILVVDDSPSARTFVAGLLRERGYAATEANSGFQALTLLKNLRFDLVVSDVIMADGDGLELRDRMLEDDRLRLIPFIVMTTNRDEEGPNSFAGRGISGYLVKPFLPGQLLIMVERLLATFDELVRKKQEKIQVERTLLFGAISSLARALNARDGYTKSHSDAVARLAVRISRRMGLTSHEVERIHLAGQLHDIGKIGVPDAILQKPGSLTPEEYEIIKTHSTVGADILEPIPDLGNVVEAIRHHHERFDGRGYPTGLSGPSIPLWARILAVADTYDSLTSDRPYRQGYDNAKACAIIRDVAGTQLCPDCVDAFFATALEDHARTPFVDHGALLASSRETAVVAS